MKRLIITFVALILSANLFSQKISELPAATSLGGSDLLPVVQSGVTKKLAAALIYSFLQDSLNNVRVLTGDTCIEISYRGELDTICFSNNGGPSYWDADGNNITNNNAGKLIVAGAMEVPNLTASARVGSVLVTDGINKNVHETSLILLHDSTMKELASVPSVYATWVRDNCVLKPATSSDKIKEVQTQERRKKGYVTFSFDDGNKSEYTRMLPLFKAKSEVADANIVTSYVGLNANFMTWAEIDSLETNGWEILSHSKNHLNLDTISVADLIIQLKDSKDTLEAHGFTINSIAYPYGGYDDTVKYYTRKYYRSGRGTGGSSGNIGYINTSPLNTFGLTTYTLDLPSDTTVSKTLIDSVANYGGWLILYIHATITDDSVAIARMIDYTQAAGVSIVTTSQALDSIGNSLDVSGGWAVNDNDMRVDGVIYKGYYPYIHSSAASTANGRNFFAGIAAGNLTLSPSGGASTLASQNSGVGVQALTSLTNGYGNSAFGHKAAFKTTEGYGNSAFGDAALLENTVGYQNTAVGTYALKNGVNLAANTAVGYGSGFYSGGNNNTSVGTNACLGASTGCIGTNNTAMGVIALEKYNDANGNTAVGYAALNSTTSGDYLTALGNSALVSNTTGGQHVGVGYRAGRYNISTNPDVIIGADAGHGSNGASTYGFCTLIGYKNSYSNRTGNYTTSIGQEGFYLNQTGTNNTGVGFRHGYNETGSYKTYIAHDSTSWANGMATASKLMWYSDASNADKANHFINLFGKLAINQAKNPSIALEVIGSGSFSGYLKTGTGTFANNDSTPSVASGNTFIYAGSANSVSIDALDDEVVGCYYTIFGNSDTYTITIPDGSVAGGDSFNLAGSWTGGSDDCITLYCKSTGVFKEVSRSDN